MLPVNFGEQLMIDGMVVEGGQSTNQRTNEVFLANINQHHHHHELG